MTPADAYALAGVYDIRALHDMYVEEDQRLMKLGKWDYDNPDLLINKIKLALEAIDPMTLLDPEEREWRWEILWFWYHHAISCAVWLKRDREAGRQYAAMALLRQGGQHPNRITRLLYLLVHDRLSDAIRWASDTTHADEWETAQSLVAEYERGEF